MIATIYFLQVQLVKPFMVIMNGLIRLDGRELKQIKSFYLSLLQKK